MKRYTPRHVDSLRATLKYFPACVILGLLTLLPGVVIAQQVETIAACSEPDTIPIGLVYGNSTTGCAISPSTENDRFTFDGTIGDQVRIHLRSLSNDLDPVIEVRDDLNNPVGNDSCSANSVSKCSISLEIDLSKTGTYLIIITESGANNSGSYLLELERMWPSPSTVRLDYDVSEGDTISPSTDIDYFHYNATAGTEIRFNFRSNSNDFDPRAIVRDPTGAVVINGIVDGAGCNANSVSKCAFAVNLIPAMSGTYSMLILDSGIDNSGSYLAGLWCVVGPCDSDGDGTPDPEGPNIPYDESISDSISPSTDGDIFTFDATAGTEIRFNLRTTSNGLDPRMEVRDPTGALVLTDGCDANSVSKCTFAEDYIPASSGTYSVLLFDSGRDNTGGYLFSLWCVFGACDGSPTPSPDHPVIYYVPVTTDTISPSTDGDFFTFNATAGTELIFNLRSTSNDLDPLVEVRDPTGALVLTDSCVANSVSKCAFAEQFSPTMSGTYAVLLYDNGRDNSGGYQVGLWCVLGDCDGDADSFADNDREHLDYGVTDTDDAISPSVEANFYQFMGTSGDEIQISLVSKSNDFDPRIQVHDPNGVLVLIPNGCDSNSVSKCSFSVIMAPGITGIYSVLLWDAGRDNSGSYDLSLQCLFAPGDFICDDPPPAPLVCSDNCSVVANAGQLDTDGDGYGNVCDADLNNDFVVDFADLPLFQASFFAVDGDSNFNPDADLTGDGVVDFAELPLIQQAFFGAPGPSCIAPNKP